MYFYPRSPCGERRGFAASRPKNNPFLSTLSLRRATRRPIFFEQTGEISIHALLAESDLWVLRKVPILGIFLSTLSLRRATIQLEFNSLESKHFYPRSPCGERLFRQNYECFEWIISIHALLAESDRVTSSTVIVILRISIHALLAESDELFPKRFSNALKFLSTLSLRRATRRPIFFGQAEEISIHALLAESDGENLVNSICLIISIHALLAESD